jgi:hypothetical protein
MCYTILWLQEEGYHGTRPSGRKQLGATNSLLSDLFYVRFLFTRLVLEIEIEILFFT